MSSGKSLAERALAFGRDVYYGHGKIEILPKVLVRGMDDLAAAYTPGVGHVVRHLLEHPEELSQQSAKDNLVAIVTDGTAVLGLGNAGPHAAVPVMEGKATMFKMLVGIDCMPLCLKTSGEDAFVDAVNALEPSFGGFNLEDVAAPSCFNIMKRLEQSLPVPVIHDDQYGTATVITAALSNALRVTGKSVGDVRVVVNGIGAAGAATIDMLEGLGIGEITAVDKQGILHPDDNPAHAHWRDIAERTNQSRLRGDLTTAMAGADAFVGVSVAGIVSPSMVRSMARDPIVFGLANPEPEIMPDDAVAAGAAVTASGRFDFPNHCNNVLAFPSLMRGALDVKAKRISREMCLAAARKIAGLVPEDQVSATNLLPSPLDDDLYPEVSEAVAQAATREDLARVVVPERAVAENTRRLRNLVARRLNDLKELS
ncbi:MAG: NADP-dependent malic enzyme [Alphaproteobacteria bacterium]